ncbi:MAG TPA: imidazole glycerol phosphate synthase subunit HisH [Chitinophagaceae bacterium]|nr:imidazole glycerol phosphate synthase subunit HisH [Chitinophagaceae bacterium]
MAVSVAIIKYNAGNIRSVLFALERMGSSATVTDDPDDILKADRVIFPGVGEASSAMAYLKERRLDQLICGLRQPVLGICLGMQLMCSRSEENDTECLGIFGEEVRLFPPGAGLKVPHMGWDTVGSLKSGLLEGVEEGSHVYFVHSYYAGPGPDTIASARYGLAYSAGLGKNNFFGVQFHPEKSAGVGERILRNFLDLRI